MGNKQFYDVHVHGDLSTLLSNGLQLENSLQNKRGDYNTYDVEYTFYDNQCDIVEDILAKLLKMQTKMLATNDTDID